MSAPSITPAERRRAVAAGAIGNFVEWFDFIAYGALAVVLAPLFFPSDSPTASLLAVFAAFAIAFVCRPLGGFIWGYIGDRWGRRPALSSAVIVMSGATMCIGLLPTANSIGATAAVLLVLIRCVQGLAAGGEWSGSAVYLVEFGDKRRRALFASLTPSGAWFGSMAGVAVVAALTAALGPAAVADWAWRVPFLLAGPLGLVGFYLRTRLQDTPAFRQLKTAEVVEKTPIRQALRSHKKAIFIIFVSAASQATGTYALVAFMVSYLTTQVGVTLGNALFTNTMALAFAGFATIGSGLLADRFGRKPVYLTSLSLLVVLAVPIFLLIGRGDTVSVLLGQLVLAALISGMLAPIAVLCVELFPANVRYAASAVGYSVGAGVIGGASPLIATALIASTGIVIAPAVYLSCVVLLALVVMVTLLHETVDLPLEAEEKTVVPDLEGATPSVV